MGGMIMGVTITGRSVIDTSTNWKAERRLELAVGERNEDPRFYQLALRDLAPSPSNSQTANEYRSYRPRDGPYPGPTHRYFSRQ